MRHSTIANIPGGGMRAGKGFSVSLKATFGRWDGGEGEPGVPGPGSGPGLQYSTLQTGRVTVPITPMKYFRIIVPDSLRSTPELGM